MEEDRVSGRIKVVSESTADLVNNLGSFKNVLHTLLLLFGVTVTAAVGWGSYKFINLFTVTPSDTEEIELLAKSTDGLCVFYRKKESFYIIEYFKEEHETINGGLRILVEFQYKPKNVEKICTILTSIASNDISLPPDKKPTPMISLSPISSPISSPSFTPDFIPNTLEQLTP